MDADQEKKLQKAGEEQVYPGCGHPVDPYCDALNCPWCSAVPPVAPESTLKEDTIAEIIRWLAKQNCAQDPRNAFVAELRSLIDLGPIIQKNHEQAMQKRAHQACVRKAAQALRRALDLEPEIELGLQSGTFGAELAQLCSYGPQAKGRPSEPSLAFAVNDLLKSAGLDLGETKLARFMGLVAKAGGGADKKPKTKEARQALRGVPALIRDIHNKKRI